MKEKLQKAIRETAEIATEELRRIFRDGGVLLVFFGACLIYPVLYGFIYKNEVYRNVPVAVVNQSRSSLSRELVRKIDGTPEINVKYKVEDMGEAEQLYAEGKVVGIIFIPKSFSADLAAGRQTHVQGYCSMASMMYYKGFYSGFSYACLAVNKDIKTTNLTMNGMTEHQAEAASEPVLSQGHALYNPNGGFPSFLMPAVLIMIIQQTLVLGIGMLAGTSREENRDHNFIPSKRKYHKPQRVIWGRGLAYFVLYLFLSIYDLILMPYLFRLPHLLSFHTFASFLPPYLFASVFFGMALSVFFWNRETPLLLYLCTSVPLLFVSGLTWPGTHIHPFWKMLSYFFPSTYGINSFIQLNTMGASVSQVAPELFAMWVQAGVYFLFTFFSYKLQIRLSERNVKSLAME
jgi:ABC-2 type transport system permease protein